jgi:hypothetical protein
MFAPKLWVRSPVATGPANTSWASPGKPAGVRKKLDVVLPGYQRYSTSKSEKKVIKQIE